ncbi:MAG: PBS lyase [Planctomycetes bacterium]|nr:PBS lyase [Planctomycetota bacterium]
MHTTRFTVRCLTVCSTLLALATTYARAEDRPVTAQTDERALIQLLQSDAPAADKAVACKQLSVYGSAAAVPELAKLLSNEQLASWARIALEAIPEPAVDVALRNAVPTLKGKLLVGTLNSIGVRRDAAAVETLAAQLKNQDAEAASSAAVALGQIGNSVATGILGSSLKGAPDNVRPAVAEGYILCAERLLASGQAADAAEIYERVRAAFVPKQKQLEATRGAILARGAGGIALLTEQLRSSDKAFFQIGLSTARELPGAEVGKAVAAELVGAAPDRAALLLTVLADRRDTSVLPTVLEAATSGPKPVRLAAIGVLPRLGDDSCVEPLLRIATGDDAELAAAAKAAIAATPDEKINANITSRLANAQGAMLPVLIEIVGLRRIESTAELLKAAGHSDASVRSAALTALGATVGLRQLNILIDEVSAPKHPEDAAAAQKALRAACVRMPEGEECAAQLIAVMAKSPLETKCTLLEILGAMGGAKSLETLAAAGKGNDPQLQDVATRLLGEWMNLEAAPVLLDLAKNAPGEKYQVRALRGYMRLARQFVKQDGVRVDMCQKAFAVAQRSTEQKLIVDTLGRSPTLAALRMAVKTSANPELKEDSVRVALAIAKKLGDKPEVRELVAKLPAK